METVVVGVLVGEVALGDLIASVGSDEQVGEMVDQVSDQIGHDEDVAADYEAADGRLPQETMASAPSRLSSRGNQLASSCGGLAACQMVWL